MPRAVKSKWTPAAEKRAAELWNANTDTSRIVMLLKADHNLDLKSEDLHSLLRRKGGTLGMIDGSERQRAARPGRAAPKKKKPAVKKPPTKPKRQDVPEGAVPFEELKAGHCRYAFTANLPHMFCPDVAVEGTSWCATHGKAVMNPQPARDVSKMRIPA